MKRGHASTLFLKAVLLLIAGVALALCAFGLPGMAARDAALHPETAYLQYPFLIAAYIFFIPFFIALHQTFRLLTFIVLGELATIAMIRGEDITHIIMLGAIITLGSAVIAIFAGLLQKLLKDAIRLKSENDLIV